MTVTNGKITGATGDRKHNYYYLNGNRVGNQGNDGIDSIDYVQELAGKLGKGNESQFKVFTPISTADFDENYMAINATYPGSSPGQWTVRDGDTLQSIASALWGDATLWYILADANGLQGTDTLKGGQVLTVPNKVTNVHNTATTFKPYDPGKAIGDTQPTLPDPPPPPEANGCGAFVQIIAIVVAVVVTVVTYGAASSGIAAAAGTTGAAAGSSAAVGTAVAAGAVAGAAGAAASQTVMIAGGQQSGFNWNGVAMGALGGAVTFGLNASGLGAALSSGLDSQVASQVALGAVRSGMTQGLGVITGAQHSFDWKGMAASAIASGVGGAVGQTSLGQTQYLGSMLSGLAAGVTSTLVRGGSLQRNMGAIAMDTVASTIGNMVAGQVAQSSLDSAKLRTEQAIGGMNGQILPGGLGGVGSGFVAPETSYSSNAALFGAYGGLVDNSVSPYSASSTLFGPSMGLQDWQRPIMLADAGGTPDNTLLAWEQAKQAASDSVNFVKGLANTQIQFVNGGLALGHTAVAGLEAVGVFPAGASAGKTPQIPYFQTDDTFAARSGNAAGFALTMFEQIPAQAAAGLMRGATIAADAFGPKLAGMAENYAAKTDVLAYAKDPTSGVTSAAGFASEAKLVGHFEKHGAEFGASSASEYLQIGQGIMKNGVEVEYFYKPADELRTGYVQFMGNSSRGTAKFGFVGTNTDGAITTIHTESGKSFWKMLNGTPADKTIWPKR
ncbi:LysM domain-containing protein [Paraburkholderia terrae]|uniref:LysM peptidoglycan-binding domain-containing protein n=1 Tax=Paraburkholderia terrae TaxID=311230 RepID=UPI003365A388